MIEPRPFEQCLLARSRDNPWNAVRRLVIEGRYEAIGEISGSAAALPVGKRQRPDLGFLYGPFLQPAKGLLYGAFIADAAGHGHRATAMFLQALQRLPHLPPSHDFWISLTAFAALPTAGGADQFEALLDNRGMLQSESLNELPLPARSNFLLFCSRHKRPGVALALVERAGPDWGRDEIGFEAWAFRLAVLEVLQEARQYDRLALYCESYKNVLADGHVEASERITVEFMLTLRLAAAAVARGDTGAAVSQYLKALEFAKNPDGNTGVVGGLLWKLGTCHSALGNVTEAQRCFERCISIFVGESNDDLWRALSSLGDLFARQGRHGEALMLHSRRVVLMERDRDCSDIVRKNARLDLARAFLASGDKNAGRRILEEVIDYAAHGGAATRALLFAALTPLAELQLVESEADSSIWGLIQQIIGLGSLSLDELEQVTGWVERIVSSGHRAPDSDILGRIGGLAKTAESVSDETSKAVRGRVWERLMSAEITIAERMLGEATESDLLSGVERLLGGDMVLGFTHRFALVRLAERAFQEGLAMIGSAIVATLGDMPLLPESNVQNAALLDGELRLYLSNLALNRMNDPVRAMTLAARGLEALRRGEAGDNAEAVRQGLLQNVTRATIALAPRKSLTGTEVMRDVSTDIAVAE